MSDVPSPVACRLCGQVGPGSRRAFGDAAIAHKMYPAHSDVADDVFPFVLEQCGQCGFIQVRDPIPAERLYRAYNFNFSSWKFEPHLEAEVAELVQRVRPTVAIDIGCNDGRFLHRLREECGARVIGVEPNPVPAMLARGRGIEVFNDEITDSLASAIRQTDVRSVVICRQVLEHLNSPLEVLERINRILPRGGHLLLDVPDVTSCLEAGDASILWEEHINYFTRDSLSRLVGLAGFEVEWTGAYEFSGGCVAVLANKVREPLSQAHDLAPLDVGLLDRFGGKMDQYRQSFVRWVDGLRGTGASVVLYGAGVRGVTFLNRLGLADRIDAVVDDQLERQGMRVPGTHHTIVSLKSLGRTTGPRVYLLAVNNESEDAVTSKLRAHGLGSADRVISVCGPALFSNLA